MGIDADTAFFTGNNAPAISIQAAHLPFGSIPLTRNSQMGTCASPEEIATADSYNTNEWTTLLPMTPLKPGIFLIIYKDMLIHATTCLKLIQKNHGHIFESIFSQMGVLHDSKSLV